MGAQSIVFQVTDVTKPLAAVSRIVDKGNVVQFGPRPEDNFIRSESGKKIQIRRERGTYVIDVEFNDVPAAGFPRQACGGKAHEGARRLHVRLHAPPFWK